MWTCSPLPAPSALTEGAKVAHARGDVLPKNEMTGMLKELDSVDAGGPRSSTTYAYSGFRVNVVNQYVLVAGGYWSGVVADEPYGPWEGAAMLDTDGVPEHVSDMLVADDGSLIVVGESWIGRSLDRDWREYSLVEETEGWMYGVARAGNGRFWVVGDRGQLRFSNDDGWHWETVRARGAGPDLFAVHFADERHGAAVGAHGTVLATHNGGRDWFELPTGLDHFLGGVVAYSDGSIVVAGEGGFLARWRPPVGPTR